MKIEQIGTPIESVYEGMAYIAVGSTVSLSLAYKAYKDGDILASLSCLGCSLITGLAIYNTFVLEFAGEYNEMSPVEIF